MKPLHVLCLACAVACACLTASAIHLSAAPQARQFDLVELHDGTGAPGRRADVGIAGDTIAAIGDLSTAAASHTLDARNLVVAPGFIDMHSHSDFTLLVDSVCWF